MAKGAKRKPAVAVAAAATLASSELSQSLDQLQYEANSWAEQVELHAHKAVEAAIECGRRLVAVKARLGHGKWSHWLGQSFDYDQRTAERYMSLAEYAGAIANQPTITRALAVIADIREEERAAQGRPSRRRPEPAGQAAGGAERLTPNQQREINNRRAFEIVFGEAPGDWDGARTATREEAAQDAFDRTYGAEALARHIDAVNPDEIGEDEPEPERDEQPRPSVAKVTAASRKPERPEPVRIPPPQLLPDDADDDEPAEIAGGLMMKATLNMLLGPVDFYVEADRLYWIGFDGIEQESDPLQLLEYVQNLVFEEMPERKAAVVAALRKVANELERD